MPNPLAAEARQLDDAALADAVNEAYRELFNLQFQKGTHQLQDATTIRGARRRIARLRTIRRERELAAVAGAPIAPLAAAPQAVISPQKQRALDEREAQAAVQAETDAPVPAEAIADDLADQALGELELERPDDSDTADTDAPAADGDTADEDGDADHADADDAPSGDKETN